MAGARARQASEGRAEGIQQIPLQVHFVGTLAGSRVADYGKK